MPPGSNSLRPNFNDANPRCKGPGMSISRRIFLRNSAIAMAGIGSVPLWLQRAALAAGQQSGRRKVLVAIFQRGAADGLNIVVPHGEKRYYEMRPSIAVPRPSHDI